MRLEADILAAGNPTGDALTTDDVTRGDDR